MQTFKYATMLPYPIHLDYEQIHKIFAGYADWANQATGGNRSVWCLHFTLNTLTIAFKRKRDLNVFAKIFRSHAIASPTAADAQDGGEKSPTGIGRRSLTNFEFSSVVEFDLSEFEQIGQLGAELCENADQVTGDDRMAYEVWLQDKRFQIGFRHENLRDEFDELFDTLVDAAELEFGDLPPSMNPMPRAVTLH